MYPEITALHTATNADISATASAVVMPSLTHHINKPGYLRPILGYLATHWQHSAHDNGRPHRSEKITDGDILAGHNGHSALARGGRQTARTPRQNEGTARADRLVTVIAVSDQLWLLSRLAGMTGGCLDRAG